MAGAEAAVLLGTDLVHPVDAGRTAVHLLTPDPGLALGPGLAGDLTAVPDVLTAGLAPDQGLEEGMILEFL